MADRNLISYARLLNRFQDEDWTITVCKILNQSIRGIPHRIVGAFALRPPEPAVSLAFLGFVDTAVGIPSL